MQIEPIGFVSAKRRSPEDDYWGGTQSLITLSDRFPAESLVGLQAFSHVEVLYLFHQGDPTRVVSGARHPRNNTAWPAVGIFAQRSKDRPNRIGSTICRIHAVRDTTLAVAELDAIDGTPVIDLKPMMSEFLPRSPVRQPEWSRELMQEYWAPGAPRGQRPP